MKRVRAAILIFDVILGLLLLFSAAGMLAKGAAETSGKSVRRDGREVRTMTGESAEISEEAGADAQERQESRKIALTFDDGPHPSYTEQLLDGLRERGVRATFFVTGEHAALHPDVIARMQAEGHLIGNHTYSHIQLRKNNREEFKAELLKTNKVLEGITGEEVIYVRPPYGSWDKSFEKELNMLPVLWTIDPLDWCSKDADCIAQKIVSQARDNGIILMHDYYESSVTAALKVVDELLEEGYTFVTVEEVVLE